MEIALGALFVCALGILVFMALKMGALSSLAPTLHAQVQLPNATGLVENASVRVAGVEIGKVRSLKVDFDKAIVTLELRRDAEIRQDAKAALRSRSLLGEKFVELIPLSREAALLEDGGVLEAEPAGLEIERLADTLGPVLEGIKSEEISASVLQVLDMVQRQEQPITELLANANTAVKRVDTILARLETLPLDDPEMVADLRATLASVRTAADTLPGLTTKADSLLARGDNALMSIQPTLDQVNLTSQDLPKLMADLTTVMGRVDRVLATLEPQVKRLENLDYNDIRYLFRREGLLVRFLPSDVPDLNVPYDVRDPPMSQMIPEGSGDTALLLEEPPTQP